MPKKEKKEPEESKLEEIVEENSEEESEEEIPEEEIDTEAIQRIQFNEFLMPSEETGPPVLKPVRASHEPARLEQNIESETFHDSNIQDESFSYSRQPQEEEKTKYEEPSSFERIPERIDMHQIGRKRSDEIPEADFMQSSELKNFNHQGQYIPAERINPDNIGRENPFEKRIKKAERKKIDYSLK